MSAAVPSAPTGRGARFELPSPADAGVGRIVIDRADDRVNALDQNLVEALGAAIRAARACSGLRGLLVVSAKPDQWIAGADLKQLGRATTVAQLEEISRRFQAVCDELAWLPCTTVAALNGPALGGGWEVALACDYRVATERSNVVVGQPEVSLGLVPAGGGTQRLPRLIGLAPALDLILNGRRLKVRGAARLGLLDEVVHPAVLDTAARAWAARAKRSLDRRLEARLTLATALNLAEQSPAGRRLIYARARADVFERTGDHYPAPLAALAAVETGLERGTAAGLEAEAQAFAELALSPVARNLIWLFLTGQRQQRHPSGGPSVEPASVERLGIVGAGFMGAAIAEVAAVAGLPVRLRDADASAVARGLATVRRLIRAGVRRHRFTASEARTALGRVSATTDASGFGSADAVIEAVFERLDVKREVIRELEDVLAPEAVIASNTSSLPIGMLAAGSRHPERIVGMHFFSPAQRMPLLEVVRGPASSDRAIATAVRLGTRLGKTPIVVDDGPGFYTTRVIGVMLNEAGLLLEEGASQIAVDDALTDFGFPVGPFVLHDEVGLAVAQHAGQTLADAFDDRLPLATIVSRLVAEGATGRSAGRGFFLWPKPAHGVFRLAWLGRRKPRLPNPDVGRLLGQPAARAFTVEHVQDRLVLLFVAEAMRCLEEGILQSPDDGDLGAVLGLGFPPFRGGPFHYADALTLPVLRDRLEGLARQHGPRYQPPRLLVDRAAQGAPFFP
jgi:3-hydroxyacyl-CoA dehydrogenase/enoyl-CoA hydratase/3-hydroxybutyryl-CoA epimerase